MAYADGLDALADSTRRLLLERLTAGPLSAGELARGLPMSRPAVSQHLRVLKEAELISERRQGTKRIYRLNPHGLTQLRTYFDDFWQRALDNLADAADRDTQTREGDHA
jgi:DNA-binding transcriptional ArsR family regulator